MKLGDLLTPEVIRIPLKNNEKSRIIEEMVDLLCQAHQVNQRDAAVVLAAVMERERVMSTGMGDGIAIPHAKTDAVDTLVAAFGVTREPVDFDTIDGKPIRMVFLLVGPTEQTGPHLKALSRISRLMHREGFREQLALAHDSQEVLNAIESEEKKYFAL
ncbi:PTS sugar transporter subunit IIA [candidate division KSB1 bacterium]|nr:PTS sugar transporter subunit IIA [candidate division KSB1 bacterium]